MVMRMGDGEVYELVGDVLVEYGSDRRYFR